MAETMKKHFNDLFPDEQLGDLLFGEFDAFKSRVQLLDQEIKQKYTDALQLEGIIEIDNDDDSSDDDVDNSNEQ